MATRDGASTILQLGSGTTGTTSWAVNPQAGDKVLVAVFCSVLPDSVVDNGSTPSTFHLVAKKDWTAGKFVYIYQADNITQPSAGAYGVTVTITGLHTIVAAGMAYANAPLGDPYSVVTAAGTSTAPSSGAGGDSSQSELYFAAFADGSALNPETITFNWANGTEQARSTNGSSYFAGAIADDVTARDGAQTAAWTLGDSVTWATVLVVYMNAAPTPKKSPFISLKPSLLFRLHGPGALLLQRRFVQALERRRWLSPAGAAGPQLFLVELDATSLSVPTLTKAIGMNQIAVVTLSVPKLVKQVGKQLSVTTSSIVSIATTKVKLVTLAVISLTVPALTKQVGKLLSVTSVDVPALTKQAQKLLSVTTTTVAKLVKQPGKQLTVTSTTLPALQKLVSKLLSVTGTSVVSLVTTKVKLVTLTVISLSVPQLVRQVNKQLAVTTTTIRSITRSVSKRLLVTSTSTPIVQKTISKTLAAVSLTLPILNAFLLTTGTALRYVVSSIEGIWSAITREPSVSSSSSEASSTAISSESTTSGVSGEPGSNPSTEVPGQ